MDRDICNTYTWVSSLGLSDSTYWESVFPCNEEFEPVHKKQRLSNEVEKDEIGHVGYSVNIPQYFELTPTITSGQEDKGVCDNISNVEKLTNEDNIQKDCQDISPSWHDFYKFMICQEPNLVTEPFIFEAPVNSTIQRRNVCKQAASNMVVVGSKVRYSCHLCSKTFPTSRGLKLHIHSHRSQRKSMQLPRIVPQPKEQTYIQSNHHRTVQKPHTCPLCERGFNVRNDLFVHIVTQACTRADRFLRRVTNGWECTSCDKIFDSRNQAECHTRTHTSGRGINCPVCHEDFTGCKGNILVKHVKQRHPKYFDVIGC